MFNARPTVLLFFTLCLYLVIHVDVSVVVCFQVNKRTPSCQPVNSWYDQTRFFTHWPSPPARLPLNWDDYAASTLSDKLSTQGGDKAFWLRQELKESQSSFVRPSVRPVQVCLEQSIFIFLGQRAIGELSGQSESNQGHWNQSHTVGA